MIWLKRISTLVTWLGIMAIMILSWSFASNYRANQIIFGSDISIQQPENQPLLSEEDLNEILSSWGAPWDSTDAKEINIQLLEYQLESQPLVQSAKVFSTWDGTIHMELKQKQAKARVQDEGSAYYVDAEGRPFPLSPHASLTLPIISGTADSLMTRTSLALLDQAASHQAFPGGWTHLHVDERGVMTVIPQWHPHQITWGDHDNFQDKAHKVHALYAHLLQQGALDSLQHVDVRYAGQVIYTFNTAS